MNLFQLADSLHIWMNSNGDKFTDRKPLKHLTTYSNKYLYFTIKTTRRAGSITWCIYLLNVITLYQLFVTFSSISKSWHFRGKSRHILVQKLHIEKIMSDSCSTQKITPKNAFSRKSKKDPHSFTITRISTNFDLDFLVCGWYWPLKFQRCLSACKFSEIP